MARLALLLGALPAFIVGVQAANAFSKPAGQPYGNFALNPVYGVADDIAVEWETPLRQMDLLLTRPSTVDAGWSTQAQWVIVHNTDKKQFTWKADGREKYFSNQTNGHDDVYYFSVSFVGANQTRFNEVSHYFNLTTSERLSSSETPIATTSTSATNSDTSPSAAGKSSTLSPKDVAAIAASAVAASLGGVALLTWRLRRRKAQLRISSEDSWQKGSTQPSWTDGQSEEARPAQHEECSELASGETHIAELPGTCWTFVHPELSGSRSRRSQDSWDADTIEKLDVKALEEDGGGTGLARFPN